MKGSKGSVSVKYTTEEYHGKNAAMAGKDYESSEGTLTFKGTETEKIIQVKIFDDEEFEKDEVFNVKLYDPEGCELGGLTVCKVVILNDDDVGKLGEEVLSLLNMNLDRYKLGSNNYKAQFTEALEGPEVGSPMWSKILHWLNVPWKLMAAIIPPTNFLGGWLCFGISLMFIGVTTALIGDIASLFGCSVGLPNAVTAITLVALGTSLPDTFASKTAAIGDPTADSSIGNVTGSNSVNVFLGLGLPWTIAAIYWELTPPDDVWRQRVGPEMAKLYPEGGFIVDAGDLTFSVTIFCILACITLGTVVWRGKVLGAELGGKYTTQTALFFGSLWLTYVLLSILKCYKLI